MGERAVGRSCASFALSTSLRCSAAISTAASGTSRRLQAALGSTLLSRREIPMLPARLASEMTSAPNWRVLLGPWVTPAPNRWRSILCARRATTRMWRLAVAQHLPNENLPLVRAGMIDAIHTYVREPDIQSVVVGRLRDIDPDVRFSAARALRAVAAQVADALVNRLTQEQVSRVRVAILDALEPCVEPARRHQRSLAGSRRGGG